MKKMKKMVALLLAFVLCLGLATTAMADGTSAAGSYTFKEVTPFGEMEWNLELKDDASYQLVKPNEMMPNLAVNMVGTYTVDGTTVSLSAPTEMSGTILADFFNEDYSMDVTISGSTFTPVNYNADSEGGDIVIPDGDDENVSSTETVEYADGMEMTVFLPDNYNPEKEYPLLITTAGGAFMRVATGNFDTVCENYADAGYICANVVYTVGAGNFPQGIIDAKTATQYMVDNYAVDKSDITMMGESAGAYIATMAAISGPSDFKADGAKDYTYDVKNLVDFYGPIYEDGKLAEYWGSATTNTLPDDFFNSGNTDLRIWIQHGDADANVDYKANSGELAGNLEAAGFDVTFQVVAGDGHATAATTIWSDANQAVVKAWIEDTADDSSVAGTYIYSSEKTMLDGATIKETWTLTLAEDGTFVAVNDNKFMAMEISGTYTVNADGNVLLAVVSTTVNGEAATDAQKGMLPTEIVGTDGKGQTIVLNEDGTFEKASVTNNTDKKEDTATNTKTESPKTGDTTPYAMYIAIVAVIAIAGACVVKRRQTIN